MKGAAQLKRGLSRSEAATYLGIGVDTFDRGIEADLLPQPHMLFTKRIWDVEDLDRALRELPYSTGDDRRRGEASQRDSDEQPFDREKWLADQR